MIFFPDEEVMIPDVLQPLTESRLDDRKVDHATDAVEISRALECNSIVVTMEMSALRFVPINSMTARDIVIAGTEDHFLPSIYSR